MADKDEITDLAKRAGGEMATGNVLDVGKEWKWKGPQRYDPDYHPQKAREIIAESYGSPSILAYEFGMLPSKIKHWYKVHEEFAEAVQDGIDIAKVKWEITGINNLKDKNFNHVLYQKLMENFGWWQDNAKSGSGNNIYNDNRSIQITQTEEEDAQDLSDEELAMRSRGEAFEIVKELGLGNKEKEEADEED